MRLQPSRIVVLALAIGTFSNGLDSFGAERRRPTRRDFLCNVAMAAAVGFAGYRVLDETRAFESSWPEWFRQKMTEAGVSAEGSPFRDVVFLPQTHWVENVDAATLQEIVESQRAVLAQLRKLQAEGPIVVFAEGVTEEGARSQVQAEKEFAEAYRNHAANLRISVPDGDVIPLTESLEPFLAKALRKSDNPYLLVRAHFSGGVPSTDAPWTEEQNRTLARVGAARLLYYARELSILPVTEDSGLNADALAASRARFWTRSVRDRIRHRRDAYALLQILKYRDATAPPGLRAVLVFGAAHHFAVYRAPLPIRSFEDR